MPIKIGPLHIPTPNIDLGKPFEKAGNEIARGANHVKDEFLQEAARAVGYSELAGLRYPVHHYSEQVSPDLTRGSRLEEASDYANLKAQGFKGIVDLTREGTADEKYAAKAGLHLDRIPIIDNTAPTMAQMKDFLDFVTNPSNQPAYVHCEAGQGRTGVMTAVYRMAVQGWTAMR